MRITEDEFKKFFYNRFEKCSETLIKKSEEYSSEEDKMRNFNVSARMLGIEPEQVAFLYMMKHFESVYEIVMNQKKVTREIWDEKIGDLINYLFLIDAILMKKLEGKSD